MKHAVVGTCVLVLTLGACGDGGPSEDAFDTTSGNVATTAAEELTTQMSTGSTSAASTTATTMSTSTTTIPTSTTGPTSTIGPTTETTTRTETTLSPSVDVLQLPSDPEAFASAMMQDVARAGPGLVAGGVSLTGATFWTSTDGTTWSRVEPRGPNTAAFVWSVTRGGPGVVAVGNQDDTAAAWTSADGTDWERAPEQESLRGGEMKAVTEFDGGLVAVGEASESQDGDTFAAVWTSDDGVNWIRVPYEAETFGGGASMWDVVAGGPGLVAVGGDRQASLVWTSPDGIRWDRVHREIHEEPFLDDTFMYTVAATADMIVAGGYDLEGEGANMWTSPDGVAWSLLPKASWVEFERSTVTGIAGTDTGWVAVGTGLWISPDGLNWSRIVDQTSFLPQFSSAVAVDDHAIVTGVDWDSELATVWRVFG